MRRTCLNKTGFTILEVVVMLLMVSIIAGAIGLPLLSGYRGTALPEIASTVTFLAEEKMEEIAGQSYCTLIDEARAAVTGFADYDREVDVTEVNGVDLSTPEAESGYSKIEVTVYHNKVTSGIKLVGLRTETTIRFETDTVNIDNGGWTTVDLSCTYNDMVVVASPNYDDTSVPLVVRIRNAAGNSFDVTVQRVDGFAGVVNGIDVHYLVIEEGVYTDAVHGVTLEAVTYLSTVTDENNSWVGENRGYANAYNNPVVIGQVMTYNDAGHSVFWARGNASNNPPTNASLWVGKHVGEDPDTVRNNETIGYIVIEAGAGTINDQDILAGLGGDSIRGVGNEPPYAYALAGLASASTAIVSSAAMDGSDGGWAILYGANPVTAATLNLAADEDQLANPERSHTTEQMAYIVFE